MSGRIDFDWEIEENQQGDEPTLKPQRPFSRLLPFILLVLLLVSTIGGLLAYRRIETNRDNILRQTQQLYTNTYDAFSARDGDLFFSQFTTDAGLRAAQLHPEQQAFWRSKPEVLHAEQHGNEVWVDLRWEDPAAPGQRFQRVAFLNWNGFTLRHMPSQNARFWGPEEKLPTTWGELRYTSADAQWVPAVERYVTDILGTLCDTPCTNIILELAPDHTLRSQDGVLAIPSPHLIGIATDGEPAPSFWFMLASRLTGVVNPQPLRYAVQASQVPIYQNLADAYMLRFPERQVEIVSLNTLEGGPSAVLDQVDGALLTPPVPRYISVDLETFPPTRDLFASGQVLDITSLALSDPAFAPGDFYEQVWQGAWWQGRMWFVPHAAAAQLIYYDHALYKMLDRPVPVPTWNWEGFAAEAHLFQQAKLADWGVVDGHNYLLYAYALQQANRCGDVAVRCREQLAAVDVAAAYNWYAAQVEAQITPYQAGMSEREWLNQAYTLISPNRPQAALWVGEPVDYENHQVQRNAGVVGWPGVDGLAGVTPLQVYGSVISSHSQRPLETWHWLTFLSYQYPERTARFVPARPSVAKLSGYWSFLPPALESGLRSAWPNARPIFIAEQDLFTPQQIDAVLSGSLPPEQALNLRPQIQWFLPPDSEP